MKLNIYSPTIDENKFENKQVSIDIKYEDFKKFLKNLLNNNI